MGLANTLQPRRRVVGAGDRDQADQHLDDPRRVRLDGDSPPLVQPEAHGARRLDGTFRHAHRSGQGAAQDLAHAVDIPGGDGVTQRRLGVAAGLQRPRRPVVRRAGPRLSRRRQSRPEERSEQVVVAEPAWRIVELDHEQVGCDHALEERRRVVAASDGRAQLGIERVQHRRRGQEIHELGRQGRQDLAQEKVADGTIRVGERGEEVGMADAALQRDRRQLHPAGHPSVSSCNRSSSAASTSTSDELQEPGQLLGVEPEVVATKLEQLPPQPPPGQRQRRVGPRPGDEPEAVRERVDERVEDGRRGRREVEVVDDDRPAPTTVANSLATATAESYVSAPARSSSTKASSATPGHRAEIAVKKQDMNRVGLGVRGITRQPRNLVALCAAHAASVAVLPYPAGADTSASR